MRVLLILLALFAPLAALAQDDASSPAVLIADRVFVAADGELVAEGAVQAYQGEVKLTARRIAYDRTTDRLTIEGPIRLEDGDGITILASAAEMDSGLRDGLLTGARMVLDQQLQLAAVQLSRSNGRFTQLYKTAVTSCRICENGRAPLWQIRARRVIHDQEERQLYFDDAQFRIFDVPVFYLPHLRLPDPTLERATGFLIPSLRTTSQLGTGLKVPYFFRLGDHADLTVEPYLSSRTRTLNMIYRQAFRNGRITLDGSYTRDDLLPGDTRGRFFAEGEFALKRDFTLTFDVEWASDNAYLIDYGFPIRDRLDSEIALTRVKRDSFFRAAAVHFNSLRDSEDESILPTLVADVSYERRYFPASVGGEVRVGFFAHSHYRTSDLNAVGRDITRITGEVDYLRSWILPVGLRLDWQMGLSLDVFDVRQDTAFTSEITNSTPYVSMTLRYPMTQTARSGATHFLEPIAQFAWSQTSANALPGDESGRVEFDQGNLIALSRFPAQDVREDGAAFAYGVNWSRFGANGWQSALTVGQVVRDAAQPGFSQTSGLSGTSSDFLVAGQLKTDFGLDLTARTLFNDAFDFSKAELRSALMTPRGSIAGSYIWLGADVAEGRPDSVSQIAVDGSYRVGQHWTASANWRYDIDEARAATAGIGLAYRNECVEVDLSLNRRYTSSTSVEPSTDFGFTIALRGFNATSGTERYVRSCSNS
jgi:LPS-assembly protein